MGEFLQFTIFNLDRFTLTTMTSYQPIKLIRLLSICVLLLCQQLCYGQDFGIITKIQKNGQVTDTVSLYITDTNGNGEKVHFDISEGSSERTPIFAGSIIEVPPNTSVTLESNNKNTLTIVAETDEKIVEYFVSKVAEIYRIVDENNTGKLIVNALQEIAGSIKTANIFRNSDAAARHTEWEAWSQDNILKTKYIDGKVALNFRNNYVILDDITNLGLEEENARDLYLTETVYILSSKDGNETREIVPDNSKKDTLKTDDDISSFFKNLLPKQRHILKSGGKHSKEGYKSIEAGKHVEGIESYKLAIEQGEITQEHFIQASLIVAEAYHEIDTKKSTPHFGIRSSRTTKSKKAWLEASLHYVQQVDSLANIKYHTFKKVDSLANIKNDSLKNGKSSYLSKAFGYDLVHSREYKAWAYTVKLKLNGCLEHANQNPMVIRRRAKEFKKSLDKK